MRRERARDAPRGSETAGEQQERDAEPESVREEERRAGCEIGVEQEVEDEGQVGADARCEADAEVLGEEANLRRLRLSHS